MRFATHLCVALVTPSGDAVTTNMMATPSSDYHNVNPSPNSPMPESISATLSLVHAKHDMLQHGILIADEVKLWHSRLTGSMRQDATVANDGQRGILPEGAIEARNTGYDSCEAVTQHARNPCVDQLITAQMSQLVPAFTAHTWNITTHQQHLTELSD